MLYSSSSNKHEMFETFPLLELQMEELMPYFFKMIMVKNGYLKLDSFGRQVTIRKEILTILAFKPCIDCFRPAPFDLFLLVQSYALHSRLSSSKNLVFICK
jgi:hypothetical protein